ncbi:MAG: hypothetical protein KGJ07_03990, partial [Patescibacteria group bacterium]|nr:hypothetical protein [Patescibacteria group bacterium]
TTEECEKEGYKRYREWQSSKIETARASGLQTTKKMFVDMIKVNNLDGKVRSIPITSKKRTVQGHDSASAEFYQSTVSDPIQSEATSEQNKRSSQE